ncbi:glycosyltransferase [Marmoricola sp. Leaf446]|uniref:glycosyltransferase n=1 Tax=Marmoricola sp. Leaf446 TaxID=1736379 RepID=UPI001F1F2AE3|nr:glycosyltransferase [Marmoricola sp. Leaf446]
MAATEGRSDVVLWFGRIDVRHKGLDLLLEALALVPPSGRPHMRLAGYDYQGGHKQLTELIDRLGLHAWVDVTGPILGEAKQSALANAGVYVHPSRWECHSIALLEALASGVPALVGRGAHISALLDDTGAAMIVDGTVEAWADALAQLPLRDTHIDRALLWEKLSWDRAVQVTVSSYRRMSSQHQQRRGRFSIRRRR